MDLLLASVRQSESLLDSSTIVEIMGLILMFFPIMGWIVMFLGFRGMYCSSLKMCALGGKGLFGLGQPVFESHNKTCFHLIQFDKFPSTWTMIFQIFTWRYPTDTYDPTVDYVKLYEQR